MTRFKMLGRDVDSSPVQYRTWIVNDVPDLTGQLYTGLKSGPHPLVDISAYLILDDSAVVDLNYPLTSQPFLNSWATTKRVLPEAVYDGQLAVIGEYVYIFGGKGSNRILRANINRPGDWENTGAVLPSVLSGSQLAIVGDKVYLFGGEDSQTLDTIYSADLSDPLTWTDHGSLLPRRLQNSQLAIINGEIYLFGGFEITAASKAIIKCSVSDPLTWVDTGMELPDALYNSHLAVIGNYVYLFGGQNSSVTHSARILKAPLTTPDTWVITGWSLPHKVAAGQFFTVGEKGYIIAPGNASPNKYFTNVLRCDLTNPTSWVNTQKFVPGDISFSHLAIIYDRVFLFGGNGSSVIYADNSLLKYKLNDIPVVAYGNVTRTEYNMSSTLDLFKVLGFANWKTDYGT